MCLSKIGFRFINFDIILKKKNSRIYYKMLEYWFFFCFSEVSVGRYTTYMDKL